MKGKAETEKEGREINQEEKWRVGGERKECKQRKRHIQRIKRKRNSE